MVIVGDHVKKDRGYIFEGTVIGVVTKLNSDKKRIVVENADGIIHIFRPSQLLVLEDWVKEGSW